MNEKNICTVYNLGDMDIESFYNIAMRFVNNGFHDANHGVCTRYRTEQRNETTDIIISEIFADETNEIYVHFIEESKGEVKGHIVSMHRIDCLRLNDFLMIYGEENWEGPRPSFLPYESKG